MLSLESSIKTFEELYKTKLDSREQWIFSTAYGLGAADNKAIQSEQLLELDRQNRNDINGLKKEVAQIKRYLEFSGVTQNGFPVPKGDLR